jgi:GNAT superfamily N-acetyltransferase
LGGVITYRISNHECEIISLNSLVDNQGLGTVLIDAVIHEASKQACSRVRVSTTNDNLRALGFYQKRGFRLTNLRPGAVDEARRQKPAIPLTGDNGIALRDEIELELTLLGR